MFDTNLVIVGNVLAPPEWRRIPSTGALVANFRVSSTARRYDRENDCWVDGHQLRVRVTAWRRLAEGVASSVTTGDPVIVYGRLYTRDWTDENDNHRVSYEMEAWSIGHDLARGRGRFFRAAKAGLDTSTVADGAEDALVGGEPSIPLAAEEAPVGYGDGLPEPAPDEPEPTFDEVVAGLEEPARPADAPPPRRSRRVAKREPVAA